PSVLAALTMLPVAFGLPVASACGVMAGTMAPGVVVVVVGPVALSRSPEVAAPSFVTAAVLTWVADFDAPGVVATTEAANAMPVVTVASVDAICAVTASLTAARVSVLAPLALAAVAVAAGAVAAAVSVAGVAAAVVPVREA